MTTVFLNGQHAEYRALILLRGVQHVRCLTLSNDMLETFLYAENFSHLLPPFYNLRHLKVEWGCSDYISGNLMYIIQKSSNLCYLSINLGLNPGIFSEGNQILNVVPQCFKCSLKTFEISNFEGSATEIHFLEYLLENALVLERLSIFCSDDLSANLERQEKISDQLKLLHRGSGSPVIEFF